MPILKNYYQHLYSSPVVELSGYAARHHLPGRLFAYLDFAGPTGTAKDGLVEGMLSLAVQRGELKRGQPVVEAASGSLAAALCIAAQRSGHPVFLLVPPSLDKERQCFLQELGAKLVFSLEILGSNPDTIRMQAQELAKKQNAYFLDCFCRDDNPEYHRRITGPAILKATNGGDEIDAILAGVGTGGTITGVGEYVKAWTNHIRMVAVEPYECQAIGGGFLGRHNLPGIGVGFVPENYNPYVVDARTAVSSGEAMTAAREVLLFDAIPADPTAGAVLFAARQMMEQGRSKNALCIFCGRQMFG